MKHISEPRPAAAQPRPNAKVMTDAMPQSSHPGRRNEPFGFPRPQARNAQSAQRNYERYLALARAEALAGTGSSRRVTSSTPNTISGHWARIQTKETGKPAVSG